MWERLIGLFHIMWDAGRKVESHSKAIDELQGSDQLVIHTLHKLATQNELLRKDNESLHQALHHERELRESHSRELELRLRLQIAEELRRLPPAEKP